ncbi:MAG: peptidase M28, partial [Elusimicrobia bacterium CG08_land_8_20_14_0_20_59_10]
MKKTFLILLVLSTRLYAGTVQHDIKARLNPARNSLAVTDTVTFDSPAGEFVFSLHPGLNPAVKDPGAVLKLLAPRAAAPYGINFSSETLRPDTYRLTPSKPARSFTLEYSGVINHPLGEQAEQYARSFSETPGLISEKGCYLSGASGWYPLFSNSLVTYRLYTSLPAPYAAVAGGARAEHAASGADTVAVWQTKEPQDEITLVCGKYREYSRRGTRAELYAFLLTPDKDLARKYLEAADKYTAFYSDLLGPYPYPKFALVENFWETGYGMPSFTLLGPSVIRLPFIINTSYPHEILHNWWGNGVFVDYKNGNWCEGLTVYLADYLIAENRGKGSGYRAAALRKYAAYAGEEKDFPLTEFRSRRSSASEAVGYGKAMLFFHMLRNRLGDKKFLAGLRKFYADNRFRAAGYGDLRAAFETLTGPGSLAAFFAQWLDRTGAPELALKELRIEWSALEETLVFTLAQTQEGPPYALEVPVLIYLEGIKEPRRKLLALSTKEETFHYPLPARILRLEVDPYFDLFRRLGPLEAPPALASLLGAKKPAIILPPGPQKPAWAAFAAAWNKEKETAPLVTESSAPPAGPYWAMGADNPLSPKIEGQLETYGARFTTSAVTLEGREFSRAGHTFVFAARAPENPAFCAGLIVSGSTAALSRLAV